MTVPAVAAWPTNAALIADVARLGYLQHHWVTLDATYGQGRWWTRWRPARLVTVDINPACQPEVVADFRALPFPAASFGAVTFDGPYRLNGTPDRGRFDSDYGTQQAMPWQDRMTLLRDGITECVRVLRPGGTLLVKCMDQVCSGQVRWQTWDLTDHAAGLGCRLADRFDLTGPGRSQPRGRRQVHAHGRPSTLLVFRARR